MNGNSQPLTEELKKLGLTNIESIFWNWSTPALVEAAVRREEGHLAHMGALVVKTGFYTGRAVNDKFIVDEPGSRENIWWGKVNRPISEAQFDTLQQRICFYLEGRELFVQDLLVGADKEYEMPIRIITQDAWHSLFARNLFLRPINFQRNIAAHEPQFTVLQVPHFHARPSIDGTNSEAFILLNLAKRLIIIGGTSYAGEIKKSIFTVMNYLLPLKGVMSMHASANRGKEDDVAIFFGLSGTGKTTLSADPDRALIGDDETGWSDHSVFNLEGGCYAKVIRLSAEKEPEITECTRRFGTLLENVQIDMATRRVNLDDDRITENTRAAYPVTHIPNAIYPGVVGHPKHIIMLTADAFGVMPPLSRLTLEQAIYYFISGYTVKVAGTECGVTEPSPTFSACFGAPFMALHPGVYGEILGRKMEQHQVVCWLINTGWTGGPYGVGERIDITHTRAMVKAALSGDLDAVPTTVDPIFGLAVPHHCSEVPDAILQPASTWDDPAAYTRQAKALAAAFVKNFEQFSDVVSAEVAQAGPKCD